MSNTDPFMLRLGHLELTAPAGQIDETIRAAQRLVASQRLRTLVLVDTCNALVGNSDPRELFGLPHVLSTPLYERRSSQLLLADEQPTTRLIIASKRPLETDFTTDNALSAWVHMPTNRLRVVGCVPHESDTQKQRQQIGTLLSNVGSDRAETTIITGIPPETVSNGVARPQLARRLGRLLHRGFGATETAQDSAATILEHSGFMQSGGMYHSRSAQVNSLDDQASTTVAVRN